METKILQVNPEQFGDEELQEACQVLRNDGLVAFPTETVYGLGGNALHKEAANHIYAAKGRPSDNPLIVHISEVKSLYELAADVPEAAKKLSEAFWPGPLTMILTKADIALIRYPTTQRIWEPSAMSGISSRLSRTCARPDVQSGRRRRRKGATAQ